MMAVMKKSGCCKKKEQVSACSSEEKVMPEKPSCHKEAAAQSSCSAKKTPEPPSCNHDGDAGKCGMQDATTCVCICYFQYAAPDQVAAKLQFGLAIKNNSLAGYLQQHWKDPHLTAPWQPPDAA